MAGNAPPGLLWIFIGFVGFGISVKPADPASPFVVRVSHQEHALSHGSEWKQVSPEFVTGRPDSLTKRGPSRRLDFHLETTQEKMEALGIWRSVHPAASGALVKHAGFFASGRMRASPYSSHREQPQDVRVKKPVTAWSGTPVRKWIVETWFFPGNQFRRRRRRPSIPRAPSSATDGSGMTEVATRTLSISNVSEIPPCPMRRLSNVV